MTAFTGHEVKTKVTEDSVQYHMTVVAKIVDTSEGMKVRLDSGGYKTFTTKKRMNQAFEHWKLPWIVYQKNHHWYLYNTETGQILDYYDGMKV